MTDDSSVNQIIRNAERAVKSGRLSYLDDINNPKNPRDYEAIIQRRGKTREIRVWIRTNQGPSHHPLYAQIIDVVALSSKTLLILCHHCTFTVTCQNLNIEELEEALHDEQVYCLQPFNAKKFDKPEEDTPMITSITRQWGGSAHQQIDQADCQGQV